MIPVTGLPELSYTRKDASSSSSSNQPITKCVEFRAETETEYDAVPLAVSASMISVTGLPELS